MDDRLKHTAPLVGYKKYDRNVGVKEIAVYADGAVKKLDSRVRGGYKEWIVEDAAAFVKFNRKIKPVV